MTRQRHPLPEANIYARTLLAPEIRPDKVALWHWPLGAPAMVATRFGDLIEQTNRVAALLISEQIGPGDRVLILVPMSPELYATILAVAQVGAISVFLDPWVGRAQHDAACAAAAPKAFFGIPKAHVLRLLSPAFRRIPFNVIVAEGFLGNHFRRRLAQQTPDATVVPVDPGDPAVIAFTTGSTGRPKPVRRSHGYIMSMLDALNQHESKAFDEVDMPVWPIMLFDGLCHGRTSVIPRMKPGKIAEADPAVLLAQMATAGVTLLTGPPALYERLLAHLTRIDQPLPVKYAFLGGAVVSADLLQRVQDRMPHGQAIAVYGSTEVEPVASLSAAEMATLPDGMGVCVGTLHPALDVKIVRLSPDPIRLDERGWEPWELPVDAPGELAVTGAHVSIDYDEDPDAWAANKILAPDGRVWHRMGDSGYQDAAGRLWLLGRASHVIHTPHGPLFPVVLERVAGSVPGVARAVLVAVDGAPWIAVVPTTEAGPGVCSDVGKALAGWPIARVVAQPSVPVDPRHNTKVDLDALRRQLAKGGLS
ncbi:MAG: AMP-binding protein [Candidatus Sericytochromatia bacterium]|nr:AMP-binding protein [Candidatus Sericytochromatia bacterium]